MLNSDEAASGKGGGLTAVGAGEQGDDLFDRHKTKSAIAVLVEPEVERSPLQGEGLLGEKGTVELERWVAIV